MSSIVHSLVSRGIDHASMKLNQHAGMEKPDIKIDLSTGAIVLLAATAMLYLLVSVSIRYTFGEVIPTLAMIEMPSTTTIVRTDDSKTEEGDVQQEILLIKNQPITRKFCTTLAHLRARAGFLSRFRGLGLFVGYAVVFHLISKMAGHGEEYKLLRHAVAHVAASILLCRVDMAWTHTVIAEASGKSMWSRLTGGHLARKIVAPAAMVAVVEQMAISVPILLFKKLHLKHILKNHHALKELSKHARAMVGLKVAAVLLSAILVGLFVIFPAQVALRRVQASLLSEEEESIVPFDRSFGGKVVPEILGGTGRVTLRDAWKTFDWNATMRLAKIYVKAFAMQAAVTMIFTGLIVLEVKVLTGGKLDKHMLFMALKKGH